MSVSLPRHALIVGAGLAGSLMACYLARAGWRVSVYERRPDPRAAGYAGGRSINLALSARGLEGLRGVGLDEVVLANDAIRMPGRMIHPLPEATKGPEPEGDSESVPPSLRRSAAPSLPPTIFQPYSKDPADAINSVSRGGLNLTLLEAADAHESVSLHFEHACVDVDLEAPAALFETPGAGTLRVEADLIIGADGAFSAVRARLQKTDRFDYSQSYLEHGYKELSIPAAEATKRRSDEATEGPERTIEVPDLEQASASGPSSLRRFVAPSLSGNPRFALEPHALHIWPRGGSMMIALPNRDGSFTCTLFWPFEGPHSFANLRTPQDVLDFFREQYPDAVPLMPTLAEDYFRNPTSSLVTVRCWPWQHGGKVVLIGDAAHAIVPFYGQGMNAAFEDCLVLARCLEEGAKALSTHLPPGEVAAQRSGAAGEGGRRPAREDGLPSPPRTAGASLGTSPGGRGVESAAPAPSSLRRSVASSLSDDAQREALEKFQQSRKPDADAIADMAVENFVEMRDRVGDPAFLYKKRVEQAVHALFPDRVTPQYNLVSFSTVPYTEARRRGRELDAILERIIARLPRAAAGGITEEQWRGEVERLAREELGARP